MLAKKHRVSAKEVKLIFKSGKFLNSPNLAFRFIMTQGEERKISFIVPKSIAKLAVRRNSLKRRGYRILKKYLHQFPVGMLGVFIFKKYPEDSLIIDHEIENILSKIN